MTLYFCTFSQTSPPFYPPVAFIAPLLLLPCSTKTIYIDHRPMMFSVDGLDSDENTFHTLGELEFEWVTPNLDGRSVISVVPV